MGGGVPEPLGSDERRKVTRGSGDSNYRKDVSLGPRPRDGGGSCREGERQVGDGGEGANGLCRVAGKVDDKARMGVLRSVSGGGGHASGKCGRGHGSGLQPGDWPGSPHPAGSRRGANSTNRAND